MSLLRGRRRYVLLSLLVVIGLVAGSFALGFWHLGSTRTVTPPPPSPEIRMSYSNSSSNSVGIFEPSPGTTFLMVHLTIENIGYPNFTADPFSHMYVIVSGTNHNVSAVYIFLSNKFPPSNLNNTQSASGDVVFEVPQGLTNFTPSWRLAANEQITIDWVHD